MNRASVSHPQPATAPVAAPPASGQPGQMSHREVMEALSGLLLAMFVAMLSSTIVSNALPRIVTDLDGSQTGYTWVVVATLLTMTATTPIWGKLADLFNKKILVQSALVIFSIGSVIAGFAPTMEVLIGARAIQGLGVGGLTALVQVVIATMVPPRERGRYSGYIGAVFAMATISGPLVGGLLVDTVGWRWCFFFGIPVALVAFVVLQKTLRIPVVKREVHIDYLGATLLVGGVSLLLVWVSLAGSQFGWTSTTSIALVLGGLVVVAAAVYVEIKVARDPIIPMRLFRDRTTSLATLASVLIGLAMFGATVYLSQYFQLARGMSPTKAGLMSVAMVGGLLVSSIISGRLITKTGRWKKFLVGGMVLVIVGPAAAVDHRRHDQPAGSSVPSWRSSGSASAPRCRTSCSPCRTTPSQADMGAASAVVAFFRSMGGSVGVSALGAVLGHQVADEISRGLAKLGIQGGAGDVHQIPDLATLPEPVRVVVEHAFGVATGHIFLVAAPFAVARAGRRTLHPGGAHARDPGGRAPRGRPRRPGRRRCWSGERPDPDACTPSSRRWAS